MLRKVSKFLGIAFTVIYITQIIGIILLTGFFVPIEGGILTFLKYSAINSVTGFGSITLSDPSGLQQLQWDKLAQPHVILLYFLMNAAVAALYYLLAKLFKDAAQGEVFTEKNLYRLYGLSAVYTVGQILSNVLYYIFVQTVSSQLSFIKMNLNISLFDILIPGLIILLIALFFAQAVRLKSEQDLTI